MKIKLVDLHFVHNCTTVQHRSDSKCTLHTALQQVNSTLKLQATFATIHMRCLQKIKNCKGHMCCVQGEFCQVLLWLAGRQEAAAAPVARKVHTLAAYRKTMLV